ncbi:MAG: hypothetical protein Q7J73_08215 [Dehalococcoidales bacterium]|nr:hypothetical protein [Dehalococcoidales bacterium]
MKQAPSHITEQIQAILDLGLTEQEARKAYPDVFAYFNAHIVEIIRSYGVPLVKQTDGSFIAYRACPDCGQSLEVSNG